MNRTKSDETETPRSAPALSDEICGARCRAAAEKSRELGVEISFAVADADGLPRLFRRFGNALVLSTILVPAKAFTAAVTRTATETLALAAREGGDLPGSHTRDPRFTLVAGGFPLFRDGKIVGGIGVGGGTKAQDCEIAEYVLRAFARGNADADAPTAT